MKAIDNTYKKGYGCVPVQLCKSRYNLLFPGIGKYSWYINWKNILQNYAYKCDSKLLPTFPKTCQSLTIS